MTTTTNRKANRTVYKHSNRAFLTKSYPTMKKQNPIIPIMMREAKGTLPKVYARYEFGQEKSQSLEGTHARTHAFNVDTTIHHQPTLLPLLEGSQESGQDRKAHETKNERKKRRGQTNNLISLIPHRS